MEWVNGNFTHASVEGTVQLNANALGRVQMLCELLELDYEQLIGGAE